MFYFTLSIGSVKVSSSSFTLNNPLSFSVIKGMVYSYIIFQYYQFCHIVITFYPFIGYLSCLFVLCLDTYIPLTHIRSPYNCYLFLSDKLFTKTLLTGVVSYVFNYRLPYSGFMYFVQIQRRNHFKIFRESFVRYFPLQE